MHPACPNCSRPLPAAGAESVRFCMYCGHRLIDSDSPLGETQFFLPDPSGSVDSHPPAPVRAPAVPARLAGYQLIRLLGSGGMGTVYEAAASDSGRRVAVKILSGRLASNPASVERFRQEGRVASQISHPRCVFVLGADADAGRPFIVMELMPGKTLKDRVDEAGPLPIAEAIARILDVIDGLAEAHRLGVIHRDVKPTNCFLTADDRVKVGDFGLSKSLALDASTDPSGSASHPTEPTRPAVPNLTVSGAFLGTVMYASPEQIRGEVVGYDSDVYAVTATLYFLLAGRAPFQHESLTASLARAVSEPPPPIRPRRPDVPRELDRLLRRGLDRDRSRRFHTLEALRDALVELRPESQRPARLGALVLAYLCDATILQLATFPLHLLIVRQLLAATPFGPGLLARLLPDLLLSFGYFALFEGLTGATPGKRLLRLRVAKLGEIGPPGLRVAAGRTAIWAALTFVAFTLPTIAGRSLPHQAGPAPPVAIAVVGLALIALQLRRTPQGFRGLHDRASGCAVAERVRPPYRPLLKSRLPNPLDRTQPAGHAPATVGGFVITGKLSSLPDGSDVYLADDRALGRRALLHVRPAGAPEPDGPEAELTRPTRLRVIGRGRVGWPAGAGGRVELRGYTALVAPAGTPLIDLSSPDRPLTWAQTRPVLEQVAEELATAEADGTALRAGVVQVWVEPNGRPQLVDFPLPRSRMTAQLTPAAAPLDLVRQVATLALEGEARTTGGRVRAPLPLHASRITDALFDPANGYRTLDELCVDLATDSTRPATVTSAVRRAHLGLLLPLAAAGIVLMLAAGGFLNLMLALKFDRNSRDFVAVRAALADPARRDALAAHARSKQARQTLSERLARTA